MNLYPPPRFELLPSSTLTAQRDPNATNLDHSGDHDRVVRVHLESPSGIACDLCNYGATLHRLWVPDGQGNIENVALGYETLDEYCSDPFFIGATVGRVANRIENGRFSLNGKDYQLERNDAPHHLHGGSNGWNKRIWSAAALDVAEGCGVKFSLRSQDGDSGYPGSVLATVSYLLVANELHVVMSATSDALTLINMAHHSYFNLRGNGDVLEHQLEIFADHYTPGTPMIPRGEVRPVDGTDFDFRFAKRVGTALPQVDGCPDGYDHNYLLRPASSDSAESPTFFEGDSAEFKAEALCRRVRPAARLTEPTSGRRMELSTNQPGLQLYTGNYLDGRGGLPCPLRPHAGLCLETQAVPNFANIPDFAKQGRLSPGSIYRHEMRLSFSVV